MSGIVSTVPGGIKSIQRGTISVTATPGYTGSNTATITSVDTAKATIEYLGASGNDNNGVFGRCVLTNSTTVTGYISAATVGVIATVGYQVTEYY